MHIDLFPQRIYKYSLNDPELKNALIQRYQSFKYHATNGTPDGWSCEVRTEFGTGSFPHEYANIYNDILYQWKDDMQFIGRPIIDEIWMNAYEKLRVGPPGGPCRAPLPRGAYNRLALT